ncbi:hypothetical protein [Bacillus cereus]|uniref:hypothetical protein n=1 Tax=Bacillus cereus TaxID=1396 RepID=UPI001F35985B|nr:hypothetical protein [Bacillus cereus]MCE7037013.1 hypothetical protein [Bacillus cereus]
MSKEKKPIFSDSYLDALANEINQLYGKRDKEINTTERTKRNNKLSKIKRIATFICCYPLFFFIPFL